MNKSFILFQSMDFVNLRSTSYILLNQCRSSLQLWGPTTFLALCLHNVWHTMAHHHGRGYNCFTCLFIEEPNLVVLFAFCEEKKKDKKRAGKKKKSIFTCKSDGSP